MRKVTLTVTPEFVYEIIRKSQNLPDELSVISAFEGFKDLDKDVLDEGDFLGDIEDLNPQLATNSDISDELKDMAAALFGLISTEEQHS